MRVFFTAEGWASYLSWTPTQARTSDPVVHASIISLIEGIRRDPFRGLGKPEPLKRSPARLWSRRITQEHRLVYRVEGAAGMDQRVEVWLCRGHYE